VPEENVLKAGRRTEANANIINVPDSGRAQYKQQTRSYTRPARINSDMPENVSWGLLTEKSK